MKIRRLFLATTMTLLSIAALPAHAGLLNFEFLMTAANGSSGDFGNGTTVDLSGLGFTITGSTTSDVDLFNSGSADDTIGGFATSLSFNFGATGTFSTSTAQTDVIYVQNCGGSDTAIGCAGLTDLVASVGFLGEFAPIAVSDADIGQALGSNIVPLSTRYVNPFNLTNTAGHGLSLYFTNTSVTELSVTASSVPEPAPLLLLLSGIALLSSSRLSKKRRA